MAKAKRKKQESKQSTSYRLGIDPTPEWMAKGEWQHIEAPRIDGHDHGNVRTIRRQSWALAWCRWGWVTEEQCKALVEWEALNHACRYDRTRSCLDMTPVGHGGGDPSVKTAIARSRFDAIAKHLTARMHRAAWAVGEWLEADAPPNFEDEFGASKADSKRRGIARIIMVADELIPLLK